jgi:hypothetical protein
MKSPHLWSFTAGLSLFVIPITVIAGLDPAISSQRQMRGSSPRMTQNENSTTENPSAGFRFK